MLSVEDTLIATTPNSMKQHPVVANPEFCADSSQCQNYQPPTNTLYVFLILNTLSYPTDTYPHYNSGVMLPNQVMHSAGNAISVILRINQMQYLFINVNTPQRCLLLS